MGIVDEQSKTLEIYDYRLATDSPRPSERFRSLMFTDGGDDFYGVIRTDVMRRIAPHNSYHTPVGSSSPKCRCTARSIRFPRSCFSAASTPAAVTT
jgi:hypothetical protein